MRSPIEMRIDKACGFDGKFKLTPWRRELEAANGRDADGAWLTLFCPGCGRFMAVEHSEYDPPKATLLELQCDRCNEGDFDSPGYWDGTGRELGPGDWPKACR